MPVKMHVSATAAAMLWSALCGVGLAATVRAETGATSSLPPAAGGDRVIDVFLSALQRNPVHLSRLAAVQAALGRESAAAGQLLPQAGVSASYDYGSESIEGEYYAIDNVDVENDFGRGIAVLKLMQPLFRPELWLNQDQAELQVTAARLAVEQSQDDLLLRATSTYLAVLAALDSERLTRAELEAVERQLEQVRGRALAGLSTDADVLSAQAQRSTASADLIAAQGKVEVAYAAMDLVAVTRFRALRALPEGMVISHPEPPDVTAWVERARQSNRAVGLALINARIAALDVDKARAKRLPRMALIGTAGYLDLDGGISGERTEQDARIGVDLQVPIFAGGSLVAGVQAAQAAAQQAESELEAARASAAHDARLAYVAVQGSYSRVPAQRDAMIAARAAEEAVRGGFVAGTRTSADVLRAVKDRYDTERAYSSARYGHMVDGLRLKDAAGLLVNGDVHRLDRLLRNSAASP